MRHGSVAPRTDKGLLPTILSPVSAVPASAGIAAKGI